jgi:hypothetical protein
MRVNIHVPRLFGLLTMVGIFLFGDAQSQTVDTIKTINFPLPYEDFSLYDFAEQRFETEKQKYLPLTLLKKLSTCKKKIKKNS